MSDEQKARAQLILEPNELRRRLSEAENRGADRIAVVIQLEILKEESRKSRNEMEPGLNSFFKGSTAGLALLDRDLRYIQISNTSAEINGFPAAELVGKTVFEVLARLALNVPGFRTLLSVFFDKSGCDG